jgi:hypothetical protein
MRGLVLVVLFLISTAGFQMRADVPPEQADREAVITRIYSTEKNFVYVKALAEDESVLAFTETYLSEHHLDVTAPSFDELYPLILKNLDQKDFHAKLREFLNSLASTEAGAGCPNCVNPQSAEGTQANEADRSGINKELVAHIEEAGHLEDPPAWPRPTEPASSRNHVSYSSGGSSRGGGGGGSEFMSLLGMGVQGLGMYMQYSLGQQQMAANAALGYPTYLGGYGMGGFGGMYGGFGGSMGMYGYGMGYGMNPYSMGMYGGMGMYGYGMGYGINPYSMGMYGGMGMGMPYSLGYSTPSLQNLRSSGIPGFYY